MVSKSQSLPFGGAWHSVDLSRIVRDLRDILDAVGEGFRLTWGEDAKPLWIEAYDRLTEDRPGMFGAVTARAEAQALRLAMIYALADRSRKIRKTHVESALAVWEYAEESARRIFGDLIGDPDADKVLAALRDAEDGMTRTEVSSLFGRNKRAEDLERILHLLARFGHVRTTKTHTKGTHKPVERWYAT